MRALSLSQPWAWAMTVPPAPLRKDVENRSWPCWASMIGARFAIHAALSWDADAVDFLTARGLVVPARSELAAGAVVALATIDRQVTSANELPAEQRRWFFGPYGFVFRDQTVLLRRVPARGMQGFWPVRPEIEAAILGALGEVPRGD